MTYQEQSTYQFPCHIGAWTEWHSLPGPIDWEPDAKSFVPIFDFVQSSCLSNGSALDKNPSNNSPFMLRLPDENRLSKFMPYGEQIPTPGSEELVFLTSPPLEYDEQFADAIKLMAAILESPTRARLIDFYDFVSRAHPMSYYLALRDTLLQDASPELMDCIHFIGSWLVTKAIDRRAVKLGVLFLGLANGDEGYNIIKIISRHDEFSYYAFMGINDASSIYDFDPSEQFLEIAKNLGRMGCFHAYHFMSQFQEVPEKTEDWLLTDGIKKINAISFAALNILTCMNLAKVIERSKGNIDIIQTVGEVLENQMFVISEDTMKHRIFDYQHTEDSLNALVKEIESVPISPRMAICLSNIKNWITDTLGIAEARVFIAKLGWNLDNLVNLAERIENELARQLPIIDDQIKADMKSPDNEAFKCAIEVMIIRGVDMWDAAYERQRQDNESFDAWEYLLNTMDKSRIDRALELAEQKLDFKNICSGAELYYGQDENISEFFLMEIILKAIALSPYNGIGWPIVREAFKSKLVHHRGRATYILHKWGIKMWPEDAESSLQRAFFAEVDPEIRDVMELMVKKEKVPLFEQEDFHFFLLQ